MKLAYAPLLALAVSSALGGCGGPQPASPASTPAQETRTADARLQGNWRLLDYRPDVPLEATFQLLLSQQLQTMVVRFDGGHLRADSSTIHVDRPYQLVDAAGPYFKLISPDYGGGSLTSSCEMSEDGTRITFHGETEPWIGTGTLVRAP